MIRLSGEIHLSIGKRHFSLHNDVSVNFAILLANALFNSNGSITGYVQPIVNPSSLVILLKLGDAVESSITANLNGFSDAVSPTDETTSITLIGADASKVNYSFNRIELWTVVGTTLGVMIAYANLDQIITKTTDDVVAVTWKEEIKSSTPWLNPYGQNQALCKQCSGTCGSITSPVNGQNCAIAFPNFIWTYLVVPNVIKIVTQGNYPLSCLYSRFTPGQSLTWGLANIILFDSCFNIVGELQTLPTIELDVGLEHVYLVLDFTVPVSSQPTYAVPYVSIYQGSITALSPLFPIAIIPISGVFVPNAINPVNVTVSIPYGHTTLKTLQVNS